MTAKMLKAITLFFVTGLTTGIVTVILSYFFSWVMWSAAGVILALGLVVSLVVARSQGWVLVRATAKRYLAATLIIVVAYPISVLVMIGGSILYGRLYEVLFSARAQERLAIGDNPSGREGFFVGLALAAIVGAVLVSLALRVLTRKWEKRSTFLLVIAGLVTIPLSQAIATLLREPNWHLVLFPVGEAFFSALCGYWLLRASPVQEQDDSLPAAVGDPHHRPA